MAVNQQLLRRPSDRAMYILAAVAFPLIVLVGYAKTYYFASLFDARPLANSLVHFHGLVMSAWVIYFVVQVALIRTKNVRLHMAMGLGGIALAALVIVIGLATAYDAQLVRGAAPPGADPRTFFMLPLGDMVLFAIFFGGAIYYRKRPVEHKALMLMTAINFLPAALFRMPFTPTGSPLLFAFGIPDLLAVAALGYHTWKYGKLNKVFAAAVVLLIIAIPVRMSFAETDLWLRLCDAL